MTTMAQSLTGDATVGFAIGWIPSGYDEEGAGLLGVASGSRGGWT